MNDIVVVREPKLLGFALDSQAEELFQTHELLVALVFCDGYVDCLHDHPKAVKFQWWAIWLPSSLSQLGENPNTCFQTSFGSMHR